MKTNPIIIENPSTGCLNLIEKLKEEKMATIEKMRSMRNNAIKIAIQ